MTSYFSIFQQQPRAYSVTGGSPKDEIIRFLSEVPPDIIIYGSTALSFEVSHQMSLAGAKVVHITAGEVVEELPYFTPSRLFISAHNHFEVLSSGELSQYPSELFIPQVCIREFRREFGYFMHEHKILHDIRQAAINEGAFVFDDDEVVAVIKGDHDATVKVKSKGSLFEVVCKYFLNFTEKRFALRKCEDPLLYNEVTIFSHDIPIPFLSLQREGISVLPYSKEDMKYLMYSKHSVEESILKRLLPNASVLSRKKFSQNPSSIELDGRILNLQGTLQSSEGITKEVVKRIVTGINTLNFQNYQRRVLPSAYGRISCGI